MKALIDGDIIVYSVGFATQKTTYEIQGMPFQYKKDAKDYCTFSGFHEDDIIPIVEAEDISHALGNAKRLIANICEATDSDEYEIFLTGEGNFREDIATIQPYKGNRDTTHKPVHYAAIKEYLIKAHGAVIIDKMEADDALGFNQTEDTVICTIDKDLDMIAGWHYNWRKDTLYEVTKEEGLMFFYTQLLTGDTVDNIRGVPNIGKVKAAKILKDCTSENCAYNRVRQTYLDHNRKVSESNEEVITEEDLLARADAELLENANLLWIMQDEGTLWRPPEPEETNEPDDSDNLL